MSDNDSFEGSEGSDHYSEDIPPSEGEEEAIIKIDLSEKSLEALSRFKKVLSDNQKSQESLHITADLIRVNPSNYTAWSFRRNIIEHLKSNLEEELEFVSEILREHQKNYQGWYHRMKIVEKLNDYTLELQFTAELLDDDSKNYHAWQYRHWLLDQTESWNAEMNFVELMLASDVYNNSAWHQRYQTILNSKGFTDNVINEEVRYTIEKLKLNIDNEAAWNYLLGCIPKERFREFVYVVDEIVGLMNSFGDCRFFNDSLVRFRINLLREKYDDPNKLKSLIIQDCDLLSNKLDTVRRGYWVYIKHTLDQL